MAGDPFNTAGVGSFTPPTTELNNVQLGANSAQQFQVPSTNAAAAQQLAQLLQGLQLQADQTQTSQAHGYRPQLAQPPGPSPLGLQPLGSRSYQLQQQGTQGQEQLQNGYLQGPHAQGIHRQGLHQTPASKQPELPVLQDPALQALLFPYQAQQAQAPFQTHPGLNIEPNPPHPGLSVFQMAQLLALQRDGLPSLHMPLRVPGEACNPHHGGGIAGPLPSRADDAKGARDTDHHNLRHQERPLEQHHQHQAGHRSRDGYNSKRDKVQRWDSEDDQRMSYTHEPLEMDGEGDEENRDHGYYNPLHNENDHMRASNGRKPNRRSSRQGKPGYSDPWLPGEVDRPRKQDRVARTDTFEGDGITKLGRFICEWHKEPNGLTTYEETLVTETNGPVFMSRKRDLASSMKVISHVDDSGNTRLHSINVLSSNFLDLLQDVGEYLTSPIQQPGSPAWIFTEPFVDLFNRRDELRKFVRSVDRRSLTRNHVLKDKLSCAETLLQVLEKDFSAIGHQIDLHRSEDAPSTISYNDLWMIYPPGSIVYCKIEGQPPVAMKVDSVEYSKIVLGGNGEGPLQPGLIKLNLWALDFHRANGKYTGQFSRRDYFVHLPVYKSEMVISKLLLVPEAYFKSEQERQVKQLLITSGRNFWKLSEPCVRQVPKFNRLGHQTKERQRVIVDPYVDEAEIAASDPQQNQLQGMGQAQGVMGPPQPLVQVDQGLARILTLLQPAYGSYGFEPEEYLWNPAEEPDEETLILCPPMVRSFSLHEKTWSYSLCIELEPVKFQTNAWERLVLEQKYKEVIQAMVNSHLRQTDSFEDLVPDKGGGVVILLHGPPGVGKTLAAESVSENVEKPLWLVTAGDLGTDPARLESKLAVTFKLATRWDAILLLDEADVFLQDRDWDNLTRNALVSIFLRALEYFKGIMFLTSNRVGNFDQAFQSRIHITLGVPGFGIKTRKQVWRIFIADLGRERSDGSPPLLTAEECLALEHEVMRSWAKERMNGRQIRNCVRSALALAQDKGEKVTVEHFHTVIELTNTFNKYLVRLRRLEADEMAHSRGEQLDIMNEHDKADGGADE